MQPMKIYLGVPSAHHCRGWPGEHDAALDHLGGDGWHYITLSHAGGRYTLAPTPWQLVRLAAWMICARVGRESRKAFARVRWALK